MLRKTFLAFLIFSLAIAGITVIAPVTQTGTAQAQDNSTVMVRFVHGVGPDLPVDIYINGGLVVPNLNFAEATPHLMLPAGTHMLSINPAGTDTAAFSQSIELVASPDGFRHTTVVIQPDGEAVGLAFYEDDLTPKGPGFFRVQAINAIPGSPPVAIAFESGGSLLEPVEFNVQASTVDPTVSSYNLVLTQAGATTPIFEFGPLNATGGILYTFVALGTTDDVQGIVLETLLFPGDGDIQVSLAHGSNDAPAVDVYAGPDAENAVPIAAGFAPGDLTPHVGLPSGEQVVLLRPAGAQANSDPAFSATVDFSSSTGAATVVVLGSLEDETLGVEVFEDPVADLDSGTARIRVINASGIGATSLALSDDTTLASVQAEFTAGEAVDVPADNYAVGGSVDDADGPVPLALDEQGFVGGTFYNVLVFNNEEAGLTLQGTYLNTDAGSLPGATGITAEVVETTPAPAATEAPAEATTPPPAATTPPPAATTPPPAVATTPPPAATSAPGVATLPEREIVGAVNLNAGVNLQCRQYPSAEAFSLGLIPNGTEVEVEGFAGPEDPEDGQPITPVEEGTFDNPKDIEEFNQLWLRVNWYKPEGGVLRCWSRADFILLTYRDASRDLFIEDVEEFFSYSESDDPFLPPLVDPIPSNYPGGAEDTTIAPPTPVAAPPTATVNVDPGVNLNLRRLPDPESEVIARIPGGTDVTVIERTVVEMESGVGVPEEPDWLFVEYDDGAELFTGWISIQYVLLSQGGQVLPLEEVPIADEVLVGEAQGPSSGASTGGTAPTSQPLSDTIFGALNTTGNLNLRATPGEDGQVLLSIPPGAVVRVIGRNSDGTWLNVTYEVAGTGSSTGWVLTDFVSITRNGVAYPVNDLPVTSN